MSVSDQLMAELKKEVKETKKEVRKTKEDVKATKQKVKETNPKVKETQQKALTKRATLQAVKKKIEENAVARKTSVTTTAAAPVLREHHPLTGKVIFHLHDTFLPTIEEVNINTESEERSRMFELRM